MNYDFITVIRDPRNILGKQFSADGKKTAAVTVSIGIAIQHHVPTAQDLVAVLKIVSEDPNAAVINSGFTGIPAGVPFLILSESELERRTGKTGRLNLLGVHPIQYEGKTCLAVGRFKENVTPSSWQVLDRDIDQHTPPAFAALTLREWLQKLEAMLPGVSTAGRVETKSSSARVMQDGAPLSTGNGHTWIQVKDPEDVVRVRSALVFAGLANAMFWRKPKYSRADPTKVVGQSITLPMDQSVWTPGRLVFNGQPTAEPPLAVCAQQFLIVDGPALDTSLVTTPNRLEVGQITKKAGFSVDLQSRSGGLTLHQYDLEFETELELQNGEVIAVAKALETLPDGAKLRCQAPFRASTSVAAFLSRSASGKPFVHDVGTSTTHWLCDVQAAAAGYKLSMEQGPDCTEVRDELAALSDADLEKTWTELAKHLSETDRLSVVDYVKSRLKSVSKPTLKAALNQTVAAHRTVIQKIRSGGRQQIVYKPEDSVAQTLQIENLILAASKDWDFVIFGGMPCSVSGLAASSTSQLLPAGDSASFPVLRVINPEDMRARVEQVALLGQISKTGFTPAAVPDLIIKNLMHLTADRQAPRVTGLLLHPTVLPDKSILNKRGLHGGSGLLMVGDEIAGLKAYSKNEAKRALKQLQRDLLVDFVFENPLDAVVAISALFTGLLRRTLPQAPGYAILAPIQASGKTTLAKRLHIVLTGLDLTVLTFPEGNDEEARKMVLASLLESRPMICFDNVTDGTTFESGVLAALLTSPAYEGRVLGQTRMVSAPTNALFVMTGNNLSMGADEVTRWLPIRLNPAVTDPHKRKFRNPDVFAHARSIREPVLRAAIGIISGYLASGKQLASKSRFPHWDRLVRQPILWAGGPDIASVFDTNMQNSAATSAPVAVLTTLSATFGTDKFTAQQVAAKLTFARIREKGGDDAVLSEALSRLKSRDPTSAVSVGRVLSALVGRHVATGTATLTLKKGPVNGTEYYSVVTIKTKPTAAQGDIRPT